MKNKDDLASSNESRAWTTPDAYLGSMARRRSERRKRGPRQRTQPERPQAWLSTIPFVVLMAALAVIAVGVMILAWPGRSEPQRKPAPPPELGYAGKGWFQEAEKQFK